MGILLRIQHCRHLGLSCFLWAEEDNKFSIAIEIKGEERFVIEVSGRGNKIEVIKNITKEV